MELEADIFFSRLRGVVFWAILEDFLAGSGSRVKPEMGMAAMRGKQSACRLRQHDVDRAANFVMPCSIN
ncbi:hypothetical protein LB534_15610 [Mesorhizobium sp. CA18]|uniref:hypothetical protein n=1 Tax=unclassified Mesorhizobium TaxID=325217 RepID=UPI001CCD304A|nr:MULTISPECIES: hypothetical protein [unclassified Mesorhizobium]MBZ9735831.1 hypothetical protein [Mesorhizobium sp. CA9]MBZ9826712.1 hypothetical protein [Mesorhizobium sp. CA18]MBZ9833391.1 hypothetical protein [Mesorhizobium sp. CA2]MBZ9838286.1 hypothetical protein [Mesorhizobium sp. CA3]MBZ9879213.1 hypothetical protein [Mesorhizobium sp. Ca11]